MPTALITGSATGVGRACAVRFAQAGYDIIINYSRSEEEARQTQRLVEEQGKSSLAIRCDVSDNALVQEMINRIDERFGSLDVLVNNAGYTKPVEHGRLEDLTEEVWDRVLAVNLKGPFFVTRAAVPLLRKSSGSPAVVHVSSVAGLTGMGSSIAYCASKGALNTMTKSLARVLAPQIRVNAVCPGPIDTRWLQGWLSEEQIRSMTSSYPIPRASTPDDVTDAVFFLATGTAMMTGQCIVVDGGRTM